MGQINSMTTQLLLLRQDHLTMPYETIKNSIRILLLIMIGRMALKSMSQVFTGISRTSQLCSTIIISIIKETYSVLLLTVISFYAVQMKLDMTKNRQMKQWSFFMMRFLMEPETEYLMRPLLIFLKMIVRPPIGPPSGPGRPPGGGRPRSARSAGTSGRPDRPG